MCEKVFPRPAGRAGPSRGRPVRGRSPEWGGWSLWWVGLARGRSLWWVGLLRSLVGSWRGQSLGG